MYDAIVIGAGHAGLATAKLLADKGLNKVLVIEAKSEVGASWRARYHGLTLFTTRAYSALPGLLMTGEQSGYPTKDEFADYLERYRETFGLAVRFNAQVKRVSKTAQGFTVDFSDAMSLESKRVFVCSGAFQTPIVPSWAHNIGQQTTLYNSQSVPDSLWQTTGLEIVIVGDGASGRQLAASLANKHQVTLACGKKRSIIPQRLFGKDVFFWLDKSKLLWLNKQNPIAKLLKQRDPFPSDNLSLASLKQMGVSLVSRVKSASDKGLLTEAGVLTPKVVILCLGYRNEWPFFAPLIKSLPSNDNLVECLTKRYQGLYFLSQPWLSCRASGLIMGVAHDFKRLVV